MRQKRQERERERETKVEGSEQEINLRNILVAMDIILVIMITNSSWNRLPRQAREAG